MALNHALKSILVAGLVLSTSGAWASKARMAALQNAEHIDDAQTVFNNPATAGRMGAYATVEFGSSTTSATDSGAEGGFTLKRDDMTYGLYLGRKSAFTTALRTTLGFTGQNNPVELLVAGKAAAFDWGASLNYSSSENNILTTGNAVLGKGKQNAYGLRVGAMTDVWSAALILGLGSEATGNSLKAGPVANADLDSKYKGTTGLSINTRYKMDTLTYHASYSQDGAELTSALNNSGTATWNGAKVEAQIIRLGVIDEVKNADGKFYYGAAINQSTSKNSKTLSSLGDLLAEANLVVTSLPLTLGFEMDASEMIVLRGSLTQNFLLGDRNEKVSSTKTSIDNNTTVAGGVGLKYKKFVLDGVLEAGSTGVTSSTDENGQINFNNSLVARAGLTYNF